MHQNIETCEMILHIVRHGQTDLNIGDHYQGVSNLPLNALGLQQASGLAEKLAPAIVRVVSSPQMRAYQTGEAISSRRALPQTADARFRERDFGIFEGLTQFEAQVRYPELWNNGVLRQWDSAPPGGETIRDVVHRVSAGLRSLRESYNDDSVALVTHGFIVRTVRFLLSGIPQNEFFTEQKIGNCEFRTFVLT